MPRSFYGFGNISLVFGAKIGFSSRPYFAQTGNKPLKRSSFFDINILYISLAKITFHTNFAREGKLFITQPEWLCKIEYPVK